MTTQQATILDYLAAPRSLAGQGLVQKVLVEPEQTVVITDRTPFYPQSGGQPGDRGEITSTAGRFICVDTRIDNGIVYHLGQSDAGAIRPGEQVLLQVDQVTRKLHSRLHSGGELLCSLIRRVSAERWSITAATHFPGQARIVIDASLDAHTRDRLAELLQHDLDELIAADTRVRVIRTRDPAIVVKHCGSWPAYLTAGQEVRVVIIDGNRGHPCMGTHVQTLGEIGRVLIDRIRTRRQRTHISYHVE